ncbi:MAG: RNA 2',3'-cyclic phosphodiesterase [Candidatus Omnitrophota bacterium]
MRIFIGIKLDTAAVDQVEKFLKLFKKKASPIRWVNVTNIHITLKFLGEIPDTQYPQIEKAIIDAATTLNPGAMDLTLSGCGKFGPKSALNIFWIGTGTHPALINLYQTIDKTLIRFGIPAEDRPFTPHITVGRNKKEFNFKSLYELMDQYRHEKIADMHVTHFQIFSSRLTPDGPIYTILKEIPLAHP